MTRVGCRTEHDAGVGLAGRAPLATAMLVSALLSSAVAHAQDSGGGDAGAPASGGSSPATSVPQIGAPGIPLSPDQGGAESGVAPQVQPSIQAPVDPQSTVQPSVQPSIQTPLSEAEAAALAAEAAAAASAPTPLAPTSALEAGLPPATAIQPGVSPEEQILMGAPRVVDAAERGLVQVNPARIFGSDAPDLTGLAVAAISGLRYSASLRTEYSDNMLRLPDGQATRPGQSRSDWHFTPEVSIMAGKPLGRHRLFLNTDLGWDFYGQNTQRDRSRVNVNTGLEYMLGTRCGGRLQADYSSRQTRVDEFQEFISSRQKRTTLGANTSCRMMGRLMSSLAYEWRKTSYNLEARKRANSRGHSVVGGLSHPFGARGTLSVSGFWQEQDYPYQLLLLTGETNKVKSTGFNVGGGYRIGPSLSVNGSIGKTKVSSRNPLVNDFSGTTWALGANYAGPKLGASITAGRSASSGSTGASSFSISKRYAANLTYRLNTRMGASMGISRSEVENRGRIAIPDEDLLSLHRTSNSFLFGVDYNMNRLLSFNADYRRESRPDEEIRPGFTANIFSLTVTAGF